MKNRLFLGLLPFIFLMLMFAACDEKYHGMNTIDRSADSAVYAKISAVRDVDSLKSLLVRSENSGDRFAVMTCLGRIGYNLRLRSLFYDAIEYHLKELAVAYELKDTIAIAASLNSIGTNFRRVGSMSKAAEYHFNALSFAESFSDTLNRVNFRTRLYAINGIGNTFMSLEDYDEAEKMFRLALSLERYNDNHLGQAINLANLGSIYEHRNSLDSALVFYRQSLDKNLLVNSATGIGLCHIYFGSVYEKKGELDRSEKEYLYAYDKMRESDAYHWLSACLSLGRIKFLKNELEAAFRYTTDAQRLADSIGATEFKQDIHELLYRYYKKRNNFVKALSEKEMSISFNDSVRARQRKMAAFEARLVYERQKTDSYIAQLNAEKIEAERLTDQTMMFGLFFVIFVVGFWGVYQYVNKRKMRALSASLEMTNRELRRSNQEVIFQSRKARESEELKSSFINMMCHEIRTPLNSITGFSSLLIDPECDVEDKKMFPELISQNTEYLTTLINDIIEVSSLDASHSDEIQLSSEDVVRLARDQFEIYNQKNRKPVEMVFDSTLNSFEMQTSRKYFSYLVGCLLDNALKFTEHGTIRLVLEIDQNSSSKLRLVITDTGCGISPEIRPQIFDRFFKGSQFMPGIGLGLYFVRQIAERLNGHIQLDEHYTQGARFIVDL